MPYQSQIHVTSAVASTVIYASFLAIMAGLVAPVTGPVELLKVWSTGVLILIPAYVLVMVILYVVHAVIQSVRTRETTVPVMDELARLIGLKAGRNTGVATSVALVAAMAVAALGFGVTPMFVTLVIGLYVSVLVGDVTQIVLYRRGV